MQVQVTLVDINAKMVAAWRETFEENPEVQVLAGSMLDQQVDAWVSPTNSRGAMDGGLDAVIKGKLGAAVESRVQAAIQSQFGSLLPVGHATCVASGATWPKFLISTPTMHSSSEDVSDTMNVALACAAAFQAIHIQNAAAPDSIRSVALPGLGANTGKVPVEICADLMWTGYSLFRRKAFADFAEMRQALEAELGDLGPTSGGPKGPPPSGSSGAGGSSSAAGKAPPSAPVKDHEVDFDDFDDEDDEDDED